MTRPSGARAGFTLIEALIAVALGIVLCGSAFAALRVCLHCTSEANRLAIENRLWRAGCHAALDEIDRWTTHDHPTDPDRQPLRRPDEPTPGGRWWETNPFMPMTFDPDFDASDPKTWWRGTPVCVDDDVGRFGDYSLFSGLGHPDPVRAWHAGTLCGVQGRLGSYATIDYLPSGTFYQAWIADPAHPDRGRSVAEFSQRHAPSGDEPNWNPRMNVRHPDRVRGRLGYTDCMMFAVTTDARYRALGVHRAAFGDDIGAGWDTADFHRDCTERLGLMPVSPRHWPQVGIDVRRFAQYNAFFDVVTIAMTSPVTGATACLKMRALGTTLRGARQQRGLDAYAVRP